MARSVLALAALLSFVLLAGCSGSQAPVKQTVRLSDDNFNPTTLNIAVGEAVEFASDATNAHSHTVTIHAPTGAQPLDKTLTPGQSTTYTFEKAGSYHVECRFHHAKGMEMEVQVK